VTGQGMALARLSSCPGLVYCEELPVWPVDWPQGREGAAWSGQVAARVCTGVPAAPRGSAARLVLAAGVASADCKAVLHGLGVRQWVRFSVFESAFQSVVHSADASEAWCQGPFPRVCLS